MLHLFRLFFLFITIDPDTVFQGFGIEDPPNQTSFGFERVQIVLENLGEKIQDGLSLGDIETILVFILFLRFLILTFRYNLKTSFYITCIGCFAGYLWYRHLIDLIGTYRSLLAKLPLISQFGRETLQYQSLERQMDLNSLQEEGTLHWYNPGQILYSAFTKGIIHRDPETGFAYYIDPLSMLISTLPESLKSKILPIYYDIYQTVIPKMIEVLSKFGTQFSGIAAYVTITRLGKRYCPYLIRWHWTFLLILGFLETFLISLTNRMNYFKMFILIPQLQSSEKESHFELLLQIGGLNWILSAIVLTHIGFILFGLFHAICGQYFYIPFLVETTELHIGPRPSNSIYSGGYTSWQDENEKNKNKNLPIWRRTLWYGWFGRGTTDSIPFQNAWNSFWKIIGKPFLKLFDID